MDVLTTDRLIFRHLSMHDLDDLAAIYSDPDVMRFIYGVHTREQTRQRIEENIARYQRYGYGLWATILKQDNRLIGRCGLLPHILDDHKEVEVAYTLAKEYWGRGLATEAAQAIRDYGFYHFRFHRLISIVDHDNFASRRVAEKNNMHIERDFLFHGDPCYLYVVTKDSVAPELSLSVTA